MNRPTCPNCREGMSFAEAGFDGLWSCIYCEGTWLSASQITSLALAGGAQPFSLTMAPPQSRQARHDLYCPCGAPHSFLDLVMSASNVAYCTSCQAMFFRKGVLKELAPQAGAGGGAPLAMIKTIASGVAVVAMSVFGAGTAVSGVTVTPIAKPHFFLWDRSHLVVCRLRGGRVNFVLRLRLEPINEISRKPHNVHTNTLTRLAGAAFATASLLLSTATSRAAGDATPRQITATVDAVMQPLMQEHRIPGMAVAVFVQGKRYYFNYGVASLETRQPVTRDTIFELGSVSKTFTGTLVSYAQVSGTLAMGDSASTYDPSLRGSNFDRITLLDLATYTAGGLPLQFPDEVDDHGKMINYFRQWQPAYPVGTRRLYSNPSIGLFGYLAAKSMGMPFDNRMEKTIFPQLGLTRTYIKVPEDQMKNYAQGYTKTDQPIRVRPGVLDSEAYGVKSTSSDMLTFLAANMNRKGKTDDTMQRAIAGTQAGYIQAGDMTQGLGWEMYPYPIALDRLLAGNSPAMSQQANEVTRFSPPLPSRDNMLINKTGSTNGFGAYVAFIPAKGIGIVMLANRNYPNAARVKAAFEVLTGLEGQSVGKSATHQN